MVSLKRAACAALLAAGWGWTPVALGVSSQYECFEADATTCAIEGAVYKYTNAFRAQNRLASLQFGRLMGFAARDWSLKQLRTGLSHDGFPNARDLVIKTKFGAGSQALVLAENVAQNMMRTGADETGKVIVDQWIGSAPHRRNMLGNYRVIGVGIAASGTMVIGTQIFGDEK